MSVICMPAAVCGAAPAAAGDGSLFGIISSLGLTTNLKLCLDAGDADSYNPAVQTAKWLDTSGNGYDFYRGTSGAGDGAEPTFNGSAGGLSSAEYFSFDGGDYFLYDTTNEAWMNTLHKDGALFTFFYIFYLNGATSVHRLAGTRASVSVTGFGFNTTTAAKVSLGVTNGASGVLTVVSSAALNNASWNAAGVTVNESATTGAFLVNSATETFTSTYSSPSALDAATTMAVAAVGGGASPLTSGARLACLAIWEGTALTSTNLTDIYNAIKGRFGL